MDPRADRRKRPTQLGRMYAGTGWGTVIVALTQSSVSHTETKQGGTAGNAGATANSSLSYRQSDKGQSDRREKTRHAQPAIKRS